MTYTIEKRSSGTDRVSYDFRGEMLSPRFLALMIDHFHQRLSMPIEKVADVHLSSNPLEIQVEILRDDLTVERVDAVAGIIMDRFTELEKELETARRTIQLWFAYLQGEQMRNMESDSKHPLRQLITAEVSKQLGTL